MEPSAVAHPSEQDPFGILFGLAQSRPQRILNLPRSQTAMKPKGPKLSVQEIQYVQSLIERCLQWYLAEGEVIETLFREAGIEPGLTALVWNKLLEQNSLFFRAYTTRVLLKEQVVAFNNLVQHHVSVAQQIAQQQAAAAAQQAISAMASSPSPPQLPQSSALSPTAQMATKSPRLPLITSPAVKSRLTPAYQGGPLFFTAQQQQQQQQQHPQQQPAVLQAPQEKSDLHQASSFDQQPEAAFPAPALTVQQQLQQQLQQQQKLNAMLDAMVIEEPDPQQQQQALEDEMRRYLVLDDEPLDPRLVMEMSQPM